MADKVYTWDTGKPTKPDVDALLRHYDSLQMGEILPYEDVAAVIGCPVGSNRFRTVTTAWRKRSQEAGIVIECRKSEAFYVATATEVSAMTYGVIKGMGSKARRHRNKLARVHVETDNERQTINHQGLLMRQIETEMKKQRMNIIPNTSATDSPRISPPNRETANA
jgi:hypothetical protein